MIAPELRDARSMFSWRARRAAADRVRRRVEISLQGPMVSAARAGSASGHPKPVAGPATTTRVLEQEGSGCPPAALAPPAGAPALHELAREGRLALVASPAAWGGGAQ